eukprot:2411873-Lingulodinium_polyedra.AAC.1
MALDGDFEDHHEPSEVQAAADGPAVEFPEVDADRRDEADLQQAVASEVHVAPGGAPPAGWRVDRFPQAAGKVRLVSTPPWSLRPPSCEPELWLVIGRPGQRELRARWQADDPESFAAQEERRSSWRRAKRGGVVACGPVARSGELSGSALDGDVHAATPRALPARAINHDAATSDGGLQALRARHRDATVETLVQQARALILTGTHGHVLLELCCAPDSELAAAVVDHSIAVRVTAQDDMTKKSTRRALHRLVRLCQLYDIVLDVWVSIPCTAGCPWSRINDLLGIPTGDIDLARAL